MGDRGGRERFREKDIVRGRDRNRDSPNVETLKKGVVANKIKNLFCF